MSKDNYMEVISIDGRKKRSKDTSELIIDTAFSLLNEGILNITHELIAKEAKIGTRTISVSYTHLTLPTILLV